MYCTHCGIQNQEGNNYCPQCGRQTPGFRAQQAPRRLFRLAYDKKIAGICSGIAKYLDADVTLIRILVITGLICSGGLGFFAYIAAWIIMPVDYGTSSATAPGQVHATG